jgi:hypothetical protein
MFQRVLAVTLAQVVRSISVVLLPIAFLSLIAWATAGSTNGNTSDPVRAAIWLWLGAHHLAFNLTISEGAAARIAFSTSAKDTFSGSTSAISRWILG